MPKRYYIANHEETRIQWDNLMTESVTLFFANPNGAADKNDRTFFNGSIRYRMLDNLNLIYVELIRTQTITNAVLFDSTLQISGVFSFRLMVFTPNTVSFTTSARDRVLVAQFYELLLVLIVRVSNDKVMLIQLFCADAELTIRC
ncbi:hypothetical protein RF11_05766 [Thelohanellus kitauei]|uniref:Uncharacterized protein n=1 Tax=Thelohanellus kitauei TaxID=669202 RepID=A0A0C2IDF3_THEKT|nr:hypothetical protein RF11_05766 [Thelohanellus kitauei]